MPDKLIIECPNCKFEGEGDSGTDGNPGIGCALLWLALIPGLIYFLWDSRTIHAKCSRCGFNHVIVKGGALGTSSGKALLALLAGAVVGILVIIALLVIFQDVFFKAGL